MFTVALTDTLQKYKIKILHVNIFENILPLGIY